MEEFVKDLDPATIIIVSALLPALQSVIQQVKTSAPIKALLALCASFGVGALTAWFMGVDTREGYVATMAGVYALSQIGYFGIYKPTGLDDMIERKVGNTGGGQ